MTNLSHDIDSLHSNNDARHRHIVEQKDLENDIYSTDSLPNYEQSYKDIPPPTIEEAEEDEPPKYHTHRKLKGRHIQLIGIGGTIGTALFVQIGTTLTKGGPGSLFLAFSLWCIPILCITNSTAEMVSYMPMSSPFIRLAGRMVDEAFEVMAGWNFFLFEAALIPFEITAANVIIHFWVSGYSPAITLSIQVVLYFVINVFAVRIYGEAEFWLSIGKVILAVGLIFYTFVTMVGGNPLNDAYGFRYWQNPGSFAEYINVGAWGRFLGFFACLTQACYTIAGPEYVSMAAGEAEDPRRVLPRAYKAVFYRLTAFFALGALCVGIVVPYNDPELLAAIQEGAPGAAASPYVISMQQLQIPILPDIVNAMILVSCFSAGNSYTYCASRSLYGLALDGYAPKFLRRCTRNGVPIYCILVVLAISMLAFLQLGKTAQTVLSWIVNLVTASQLINFAVLCITYIRFYKAMQVQGFNRDSLPYKGFFQPYCAYIGLVCSLVMVLCAGYPVFLRGQWDLPTFLFSYIMIAINIVIFVGWKLFKRTKFIRSEDADLMSGCKEIDDYYETYVEHKPTTWYGTAMRALIG